MNNLNEINIKEDHLCPICLLGKQKNTITCKSVLLHASKWND